MVSISCWHLRHLVTMKKVVKEIYLQTCLDKQQSQKYCFCFSLKYILCILKAALNNIFTLTIIIMNITEKGVTNSIIIWLFIIINILVFLPANTALINHNGKQTAVEWLKKFRYARFTLPVWRQTKDKVSD